MQTLVLSLYKKQETSYVLIKQYIICMSTLTSVQVEVVCVVVRIVL